MNSLLDQFLRGINDLFRGTFRSDANVQEFTPYSRQRLTWDKYDLIADSNGYITEAVMQWGANVGDAGWRIESSFPTRSDRNNKKIKENIEQILTDLQFDTMVEEITNMIAIKGSTFVALNSFGTPKVYGPDHFNVHANSSEKEILWVQKLEKGVPSQKKLIPNKDVWIFKDPAGVHQMLPAPRIDRAYEKIVGELHIWKGNNNKWANGLIDPFLLMLEGGDAKGAALSYWGGSAKGDKKSRLERLLERVKSLFVGSKHAGELIASPFIKDIKQITRTAKEMLGEEFLNRIEKIYAITWSLKPEDLVGGAKYDNATAYNHQLGDKVGRKIESQVSDFVNKWLLVKFGVQTNKFLKFSYNKPRDPKQEARQKLILDAYVQSHSQSVPLLTLDETREVIGFGPAPDELKNLATVSTQPATEPNSDTDDDSDDEPDGSQQVRNAAFSSKKTPTERALRSSAYSRTETDDGGNKVKKGFLPQWEKAFTKQLEKFARHAKKADSLDDITFDDFPKIETFYSMNTLKRDLMGFARIGYDEFLKTTKKSQNASRLPEVLRNLVSERAVNLLQGGDLFDSVDVQTYSQVETILDNSETVQEFVDNLLEKIPGFAKNRAELVAETEVGNAIEESRFVMYESEGWKFKKWLTARDEIVRDSHQDNERQGWIPINEPFSNGNMKPGEDARCRCTAVYSLEGED